jgi:hypothetical protein
MPVVVFGADSLWRCRSRSAVAERPDRGADTKHRNDDVTAFGQGAGQFAAEQAAGAGDEDAQQITRHQRTIRLAPYAPPHATRSELKPLDRVSRLG